MKKEKVKVLVEMELDLYSNDYEECSGIEDAAQQYFDDLTEYNSDFYSAKVKECDVMQEEK